jgi:hypothetical protein
MPHLKPSDVLILVLQFPHEYGDQRPVWFVAPAHPTKKLVMPNSLPHVWFIANYLAANGLVVSFTSSPKNLAAHGRQNPTPKNWLTNFGRVVVGTIKKHHKTSIRIERNIGIITILLLCCVL